MGSGLIAGVASLEGDNYVVFYYLTASEIWPDKRGSFGGKWHYSRGGLSKGDPDNEVVPLYQL